MHTIMATLLLVSSQGRQRVALELAAQDAGHRTYSAGSLQEACRLLRVYVPEAVLLLSDLPDGSGDEAVRAIRESDRPLIREMPIVTPLSLRGQGIFYARSRRPEDILRAVNDALGGAAQAGAGEILTAQA